MELVRAMGSKVKIVNFFSYNQLLSNVIINLGAKAGIGIWFNHGHPNNHSSPIFPGSRPTNNVAEIQAAIKAVQIAKNVGISKLEINTDSMFMINRYVIFALNKIWRGCKSASRLKHMMLFRIFPIPFSAKVHIPFFGRG